MAALAWQEKTLRDVARSENLGGGRAVRAGPKYGEGVCTPPLPPRFQHACSPGIWFYPPLSLLCLLVQEGLTEPHGLGMTLEYLRLESMRRCQVPMSYHSLWGISAGYRDVFTCRLTEWKMGLAGLRPAGNPWTLVQTDFGIHIFGKNFQLFMHYFGMTGLTLRCFHDYGRIWNDFNQGFQAVLILAK